MSASEIILVGASLLLLLATALPLIRHKAWWIRVFDFPKTQLAVLIVLVLLAFPFAVGELTTPYLLLALALVAALAAHLFRVFPYTPLAATQVVRETDGDTASRIRLLIANVLMHNRRADDFIALVRRYDPDVVMAVETDRWWDERLSTLDRDYPFALKCPLDNTYGMHLLSRLELGSPELRFLVDDEVPSVRTAIRLRSGAWIDFYGVHPNPPRPGDDTGERDAELLLVGKEVKATGRPAIIAGDLNDVAWSHSTRLFQRISGMLDPRIGRGAYSTFHAKYPGLRWALDHVFHSKDFALVNLRRLPYFGSDHFPVLVELCLHPAAAAIQEAPSADRGDQREAAEKIADGREDARG